MTSMDSVCGDYGEQLEPFADFLRGTTDAGLTATRTVTAGTDPVTT